MTVTKNTTPKAAPKVADQGTAKPIVAAQKSVQKPVGEAAPKPVAKPAAEAAPKPVVKPAAEAAPKPVVKPVTEAAPKPVVKPAAEAAPKPVVKPVAEAAPKVAAKKPTAKKVAAKKSAAKKPAAKKPTAKPVMKPAAKAEPVKAAAPIEPVDVVVATTMETIETVTQAAAEAFKGYGYDEAVALSQDGFDAVTKANTALVKGVQEINAALFALFEVSLEVQAQSTKKILACKSLDEAVAVQNDLVKSGYETAVAETQKIADLSVKVTEEAAQPITEQMNAAVEKLTKLAA